MSSNARASGMPSSSAGKEVGDIVQTPDAPIKSWRYLGGGKWEPNDVVRFTETSPGGGNRFLRAGGDNILRRQMLLEAFPLPTMRSILDPDSVDLNASIKPEGATISIVDAPGEMYGRAIKIELPAGLTTTTGRVMLPLKPAFDGSYPRCSDRIEWRMRVDDHSTMTQFLTWLSADNGNTPSGYYWAIRTGTSRYGVIAPHQARWNSTYRTFVQSAYLNRSSSGGPAWDAETQTLEVQSIRLTCETTAPTVIYLNRVANPVWARGAMITQMDGGYALSYEPVFEEFRRRGWPGVASFIGIPTESESVSAAVRREMVRAGWDVCQHVCALTDAVPPVASAMTGATTADQLRRALAGWRAVASAGEYLSAGAKTYSQLTNAGPSGLSGAAAIYKSMGISGGRGRLSDGEFGIDPYNAQTNSFNLSEPWPGGWSPMWGRYNRYYFDAVSGLSTPEARNTYAGSSLETLVRRVSAGSNLAWIYIHRVQDVTETTPSAGNAGPALVRDYISHLESLESAGSVLPISATEADFLTYDRPGIHLRWDGAWVDESGNVAL